jgi:hypothetical protein
VPLGKEQPSNSKVRRRLGKRVVRKELDCRVSNLRERFGQLVNAPSNDDLINVLASLNKDVSPQVFLDKTEKPFCLECLNSAKKLFLMVFIQDSDEFCCPNCGITIPKISSETSRPTDNHEEAKKVEFFYKDDNDAKSYIEIERLLTKYEEGSPRKMRMKKKSKISK